MASLIASNEDLREIEQLLYQEAAYLDNPDLDSWIELYTQDGTYWMPASLDQKDPHLEPSHIYDDRVMMEIRRRNYLHPRSASKEYKTRSSHIISNLRIAKFDEATGDCTIISNFHALVNYMNDQRAFGGTYTHELTRVDGEYKIRHKRVDLINCEENQRTTVIYL